MPVSFRDTRGFSLVEVIVGLAIFGFLSAGIITGIRFVFKAVYQSRIRVLESEIVGEQLEIVRNMPFDQIGIVNGLPAGILARTVTTTRSGVNFTTTRTIRNIDDPYDGTIGGSPNDTAPADYKYVEVSTVCDSCGQSQPLIANTIIAPKFLEGNENTGALFIQVFNGSGVAVQGATVHVIATSTSPTFDLIDTTDKDGMLRLVGLPPKATAYVISVSKTGYTADGTYTASSTNPNPIKPPATVVAQQVTQISFSIDVVAQVDVTTVDLFCQPVTGVSVETMGTKTIGMNPNVLFYDTSKTTTGQGTASYAPLVWDNYQFTVANKDIVGAIPGLPVVIQPGVVQPVTLLVGANTANSLLIHVRDSVTLQPLSQASVHVTSTVYDEEQTTGVGHVSQTDWSGGGGQTDWVDVTRYATDNGYVAVTMPSGDIKLSGSVGSYASDGVLESSIINLGVIANPVSLIWEPLAQPVVAGDQAIRFQIATSDSASSEWNYLGYDGTSNTYYDATHTAINAIHNGNRYLRYKLFLHTDSVDATPVVSTVSITYTTSCTPPGQTFFGGISTGDYGVSVGLSGYQTAEQIIHVSGDTMTTVDLIHQ